MHLQPKFVAKWTIGVSVAKFLGHPVGEFTRDELLAAVMFLGARLLGPDKDLTTPIKGEPGMTATEALARQSRETAPDNVNHPAHYTAGAVECIDAIQAALTPEEFRGYCKGNALKYTWRERHKGGAESLAKAQWYLNRLTGSAK